MKQRTLAMMTGFEQYTRKTRRAIFLEEMEQVVPWGELCALVAPHYPQPGKGRRPVGVERMLRIYFLQQWFNLSDPAVEEALYDSVVMRQFVGIDLGCEPVPDETTVCKFRHLLEEHRLGERILLRFAPLTEERAFSSASSGQHLGSAALYLESTKRSDHEIRLIPPLSPRSPTVGSFASPFADFTARCLLRLCICIGAFDEWKGTRVAKQNREVWWIRRPGFRLPFRVSSWAGGTSCAIAAALATLLFYESSFKAMLPLGFLTVIAGVAILFGRLGGIVGTVTTSLVFASVLFEPRPSLAVADPVAKSHLAWMAAIGLVLSDLMGRRKIAATPARRKSHGWPC